MASSLSWPCGKSGGVPRPCVPLASSYCERDEDVLISSVSFSSENRSSFGLYLVGRIVPLMGKWVSETMLSLVDSGRGKVSTHSCVLCAEGTHGNKSTIISLFWGAFSNGRVGFQTSSFLTSRQTLIFLSPSFMPSTQLAIMPASFSILSIMLLIASHTRCCQS